MRASIVRRRPSVHPSLNSSFSKTALWVQAKFWNYLSTISPDLFCLFFFFKIFNCPFCFSFSLTWAQESQTFQNFTPPTNRSRKFSNFSWILVSNILTKSLLYLCGVLFMSDRLSSVWGNCFWMFWNLTWSFVSAILIKLVFRIVDILIFNDSFSFSLTYMAGKFPKRYSSHKSRPNLFKLILNFCIDNLHKDAFFRIFEILTLSNIMKS